MKKYREKSGVNGEHWDEATYKIGLCFQNMNLKLEAKSFFQEVVDNKPNSPVATSARKKLNTL